MLWVNGARVHTPSKYTVSIFDVSSSASRNAAGEMMIDRVSINVETVMRRWPGAKYSILLQRSDGVSYPGAIDLEADEASQVYYTLTASDTALAKLLRLQVQAREGGVVVQSCIFLINVLSSLSSTGESPPVPEPSWIEEVIEAAQAAEAARDEALVARDEAVEAAESSGSAADHQKLKNRDAEDAHPIKSVSGLIATLNELEEASPEPITNEELKNLFK